MQKEYYRLQNSTQGTKNYIAIINNIAGRLKENSRNSFVDLQSQKTVKKTDQKNSDFN